MADRERLEKLRRLKELREKANRSRMPEEYPTAKVSPVESATAGFAQGATLGFGEELMGGLKSLGDVAGDKYSLSDLPDRYRQRRDEYRAYNELAREKNPASYTGGEIGGGVATAFVPGGGAGTLAKAAGMGAASGLGLSTADVTKGELGEAALDTAGGAALGGAVYGAGKLIQKGIEKVKPQNVAKAYLGMPEQAYERYAKNPDKVKALLSQREDHYGLPRLAERLTSRVDDLSDEAVSGSRAGRETLKFENTKIGQDKLRAILQKKLADMRADEGQIPNDAYARAKEVIQSQLDKLPKGEITPAVRAPNGRIVSTAKRLPDPDLTGTEAMDRVRELRKAVDFTQQHGKVDSKSAAIIKQAAHEYDQLIKDTSPAYRGILSDSEKAMKLLERVRPVGSNEQGAMNFLGSIDKAGRKFKADAIKDVDKHFGDTIAEDTLDAIAARSIDRSAPAGSQRVNLFGKVGRALGTPFGESGRNVGEGIGNLIGGGADAYGRRAAVGIIDKSLAIQKAIDSNRFTPQVRSLLNKAAQRGDANLVLTFQLLSQKNPELMQSLQP